MVTPVFEQSAPTHTSFRTNSYPFEKETDSELQAQLSIGSWHLQVRVEQIIPSQLDEAMRQRLLQENFESWLQEQPQQLLRDQWLGVAPSHYLNKHLTPA